MSQNTTFESYDAKVEPIGLEEVQKIEGRFNQETRLGQQIAEASPEAKRMISDQLYMEDRQMEAEQKSQARSHEFRVLRERDKLTRDFFSRNEPIPSDPAAKQVIYDTICEQADRRVQEREQYYQDQIPRQTERNVSEIIRMDRDGTLAQRFEHAQTQKQGQ